MVDWLIYNRMVVDLISELTDDAVDRIFRALADATRRDIVRRTLAGEASVSALGAASHLRQPGPDGVDA